MVFLLLKIWIRISNSFIQVTIQLSNSFIFPKKVLMHQFLKNFRIHSVQVPNTKMNHQTKFSIDSMILNSSFLCQSLISTFFCLFHFKTRCALISKVSNKLFFIYFLQKKRYLIEKWKGNSSSSSNSIFDFEKCIFFVIHRHQSGKNLNLKRKIDWKYWQFIQKKVCLKFSVLFFLNEKKVKSEKALETD